MVSEMSDKPTNMNELRALFVKRAADVELNCDVLMDGILNAQLAIVAEAPGAVEIEQGRPLVGGSGKLLWQELRDVCGINRMECYVTNVIKKQLLATEHKRTVFPHEKAHWDELLRWELSCLPNLRYVLVLGNAALDAIIRDTGVNKWRGSVVPYRRYPDSEPKTAVISFNPAAIIRDEKNKIAFRMDMHKLDRVMKGEHNEPKITAIINPSPTEAVEYINRMHDEKLPVSIDIETISGETACVGLGNSAHEGMCINFRDRTKNRWSVQEEQEVRNALDSLARDRAVRFVAQNGVFDATWLWFKDRIKMHGVWFDTLLAHHALYPALPHNLGFLTSMYTDHPYYKDEKADWPEGIRNEDPFGRC